jgi:hypothetical protein
MDLHRFLLQYLVPLALITLIVSGCDTGRVGMYKVSLVPAATDGESADEQLKRVVRGALAGEGFQEKPGTPHIWRKRGTTVEVYRDHNSDLILRVGAFGSQRDVRVSQRTEQQLLDDVKQYRDLELTPQPAPKATVE